MIPADIDPSLSPGEPLLDRLDDGFSPPASSAESAPEFAAQSADTESALGAKSPF